MQKKIIILTGPTAVGKSSIAIEVARELKKAGRKLEIINADSVCFYQEFNIGSAKPNALELEEIPHHLINIADPAASPYHAAAFKADLEKTLLDIQNRNAEAIVVGGSGFYLNALLFGLWDAPETNLDFRAKLEPISTEELFAKLNQLDSVHAKKIGNQDRYRIIRALEIIEESGKLPSAIEQSQNKEPDPRFTLWIMDRPKEELEARILERVFSMLNAGWIEEVKMLKEKYPQAKALQSVGYAQVLDYLNGIAPEGRKLKPGLDGLREEITLAHRQLAKSQRTWFKNLCTKLGQNAHSFLVNQADSSLATLKEKLMTHHQ